MHILAQQALRELDEYLASPAFQHATTEEARVAQDLQALLQNATRGPAPALLTVQSALQVPAPDVDDLKHLPLTW